MNETAIRRIVLRHTAGPYPGLRQIIALASATGVHYLHTGETRAHTGPLPDMLAAFPCWPDGRLSKGMRLKTSDKYVLYQESPVASAQEAA